MSNEIKSTAPYFWYDFTQNTADRSIHISVHSLKTGEVFNMQLELAQAKRLYESLTRTIQASER